MLQYYNCGDCFIIRLHLIPLISGQMNGRQVAPEDEGVIRPACYGFEVQTDKHATLDVRPSPNFDIFKSFVLLPYRQSTRVCYRLPS